MGVVRGHWRTSITCHGKGFGFNSSCSRESQESYNQGSDTINFSLKILFGSFLEPAKKVG